MLGSDMQGEREKQKLRKRLGLFIRKLNSALVDNTSHGDMQARYQNEFDSIFSIAEKTNLGRIFLMEYRNAAQGINRSKVREFLEMYTLFSSTYLSPQKFSTNKVYDV
jgi:hypothetical protein